VLEKNVTPENAVITIDPQHVSGRLRTTLHIVKISWCSSSTRCDLLQLRVVVKKDGADVVVLDKPLFDEVVVDQCTVKHFATKVSRQSWPWARLPRPISLCVAWRCSSR
jgi:hypothetical protein